MTDDGNAQFHTQKPRDEVSFRMPPQNKDAEMAVLGSFMLDPNALVKVADILSENDFYYENHKLIYKAILDLFEKRKPTDVVSVSSRLKEKKILDQIGGMSYIAHLVNTVPTAAGVVHYAEIVNKKRILRDLIEASQHINFLGYREDDDVERLLDEAEQKIFSISQSSLRNKFIPAKNALEEAFNRIDRLHKNTEELRGVPTGFKQLDTILSGLQPSDLIIVACRPSMGKTSFAMDVARHAALLKNIPVGIFSLEMSIQQLVDRLIAAESRIDLWKLRTGRLHDDEFPRLSDALARLSGAPLFIDDEASANILQIRTKARRLQAERGLGLVIIDYLQLIQPRANSDNLVAQITEISRSLKGLARELDVPVLALSQLSRSVEQRHPPIPRLSDLRDSGCLAGDTLLMRADTGERIPIKNLAGKTNIPIISLASDQKLRISYISKVFSSGIKQIFELRTRSGRRIKASGNHPFLTIRGWIPLENLEKKMHVALPRFMMKENIQKVESPLSHDELILLAHLIGDGCVVAHQPIHYTSADRENIAIVAKTAKWLFNIKPRVVRQKNWFHLYLPSPYPLTRGRHHPIVRWYNLLGLEKSRSYEKKLPPALFRCSNKDIQIFLHHLWATDGNISYKIIPGRKPSGAIYYATTSEALAEGVQHLLLRLGIHSTLRIVKQGRYRDMFQIHIQGKEMQMRFCMYVGSYGNRGHIIPELIRSLENIQGNVNLDIIPREIWRADIAFEKNSRDMSWREFAEGMEQSYQGSALFQSGISRERMSRIATAIRSEHLMMIAESDIYWDEIVSIIPLGQEEVFDATVEGTHNFIANDFIVHNSIEQDADVVMFIYREDRYKQNSEKQNQADILIEKHRNGPIGKVTLYFTKEYASFSSLETRMDEGAAGEW